MITQQFFLHEGREDVSLTTYVLSDSRELLDGRLRPGILICPGGGYLNCSDREAEPIALRFAAMGYHAFVLRYSVYMDQGEPYPVGKSMQKRARSLFPNSMQDIGLAFLKLREHASEWKLDTKKIALCGFSAGAHNSAMYATHYQGKDIAGYFQQDAEIFKPAACILAYGLYDYCLLMENPALIRDPFAKELRKAAAIALLGSDKPSQQLLEQVSPARQVSAHTPPLFLWATGEDSLVPVSQTAAFTLALSKAGIPFEAHVFESGPHGLSLADQATAGSRFELNPVAAQWLPLAQTWLEKRLALPLREIPLWMEQLER